MITESGSANTPAFKLTEEIQEIWLWTSCPASPKGIKVVAETALANAKPTAV
jgi:hypothetical protein